MTIILGGIGAAAGSMIPGAGWMIGWSIGASIGGIFDAMNVPKADIGKLSDLKYSGSSFGTAIPRVWGRTRVSGNVIWVATDANGNHLVDHKRSQGGGKGMGGGGATYHWYSATLAVAFCAGSIFCPDPTRADGGTFISRNPVIKKLWADDVLIYDADKTTNVIAPTWHSGSEVQGPDSTIVAKMGVSSSAAPAFPGLAYAVLTDMSLEDFSNRVPNFSAEIETDAVTLGDVFSDLCRSAGVLSTQIDATAGSATSITGFVAASRGEIQSEMNGLLLAYGFDVIEADGLVRLVGRGAAPLLAVAEDDLGATTGSNVVKMTRKRGMITELPGRVEVTFADAENSFLTGSLGVVRQSADVQNVQDLQLSLSLIPDEARVIAGRELDRYWAETESYTFALPPKYLKVLPGDVVSIPLDEAVQRVRITRVGLAPLGELKFDAVLDDPAIFDQPVAGGGSGVTPISLTPVPSVWEAWSGAEVRDADQAQPGFYIAASGPSGWSGGTVFYSTDSGANWIEGPAITGNCIFGASSTALSAAGAVADAFDDTNTVDLSISLSGGVLSNMADSSVIAGNNHAILGGEIIGFGVATLQSAMAYRLSHIRRGERGSTMSGHTTSDLFVALTPDVVRVNVSEALVGETVLVKVVSRYETLSDVTTSKSVVIAARTLTNQEQILASVVFPRFIAPTSLFSTVGTHTTGTAGVIQAWATYDLSAFVPETAIAVMLSYRIAEDDSIQGWRYIESRANSGGQVYQIGGGCITRDDADFGVQGVTVVPLDSGSSYRHIDLRVVGETLDTFEVAVVGYYG